MTEEEFEIEYLDEDEDLVQQCVQGTSTANLSTETNNLLVKRELKKKRKYLSDDYDYVPEEKKKPQTQTTKTAERKPAITYPNQSRKLTYTPLKNDVLSQRKLLKVRIPDYDDPLCLPAQSIKTGETDHKRIKSWNNLCLEQLRISDQMFRPDTGEESVSSTRTIIFKNVQNKSTGKHEVSVWSKTTCEGASGERKSAILQCTLPKYKGKTSTRTFNLLPNKKTASLRHIDEAVLTKEVVKEEETLVVYKPKDFISAVYMFEENEDTSQENLRRLTELSVCKMCVLCYQTSWRGFRKNEKKTISCAICNRLQVSVYSLLTHLKTHSAQDVKAHRKQISKTLASIVDYHYKCRICLRTFDSIKVLKKHVPTHKGVNMFHCEVGSHQTM